MSTDDQTPVAASGLDIQAENAPAAATPAADTVAEISAEPAQPAAAVAESAEKSFEFVDGDGDTDSMMATGPDVVDIKEQSDLIVEGTLESVGAKKRAEDDPDPDDFVDGDSADLKSGSVCIVMAADHVVADVVFRAREKLGESRFLAWEKGGVSIWTYQSSTAIMEMDGRWLGPVRFTYVAYDEVGYTVAKSPDDVRNNTDALLIIRGDKDTAPSLASIGARRIPGNKVPCGLSAIDADLKPGVVCTLVVGDPIAVTGAIFVSTEDLGGYTFLAWEKGGVSFLTDRVNTTLTYIDGQRVGDPSEEAGEG